MNTFQNDNIIIFELNKKFIKKNKEKYEIDLKKGIKPKLEIEFDHRTYNINVYISLNELIFNKNTIFLLRESNSNISDKNDKYYKLEKNKNIIYFDHFDETKIYSVIYFNIKSNNNNVSDNKFTFGLNWLDLVDKRINTDIIESSKLKIDEWFENGESLKGKSVIDIGCGSGIHSFNILRYCDNITSLDVDINCIKATKLLSEKFGKTYNLDQKKWNIIHKSILDKDITKLGTYDIVYSWGVLHHTGDMWDAILNASKLCKKNGIMLISLYSVYNRYFPTLMYKLKFNQGNKNQKIKMIADRVMVVKNRNKTYLNWNKLTSRGMNVYNDIIDWLGGYPYEVCTTELITKFLNDFVLIKKQDNKNRACHEWLFKKN